MLKGHGDDIYDHEQRITSNFSSNIYGKQDLSVLQQHLCSCINLIRSYPESDAGSLARLLAKKHHVECRNICVTNGATEAIYLLAQTFRNSRSNIVIPTFREYEDACLIHNHELSFFPSLSRIDSFQNQLVWICNPNNPDGNVYDIDFLIEKIEQHNDSIFIIDQSYEYFTEKQVWDASRAVRYKNVVLIHSMTKQYGIPGLRLGYITAHIDLINKIEKARMPWSVNGLAIEAGKFLIENEISFSDSIHYLEETKRLQEALRRISGILIHPTHTHFFLCRLENRKASDLKLWLIKNYGILIRDASNFRGLDEHYFRIATQSPEENDLLVKAIKEWI
jgi:Histidinol-phosphate/aromatic aminotransferase and cobyric acid decarboxylase